jgi:tetratricopeptide (TPR) repeat protein
LDWYKISVSSKEVEKIYLVKCPEEQEIVVATKGLIAGGRNMYASSNLWGAVQEYKTATELEPSNGDAHYWLGRTLLKLGLYNEAIVSLSRAD